VPPVRRKAGPKQLGAMRLRRVLVGLLLVPSMAARRRELGAPSDQKDVLMRLCEMNPHATIPEWSGGPKPLCGNGGLQPTRTALSHWKKPRDDYAQWSWGTDPCRDKCEPINSPMISSATTSTAALHVNADTCLPQGEAFTAIVRETSFDCTLRTRAIVHCPLCCWPSRGTDCVRRARTLGPWPI
jgi:hypothetical protein